MVYSIQSIQNTRLDHFYEKSMEELDNFFQLDWKYNRPKIILVPDRKTINELKNENTEAWLVGWQERGNIYLLAPESFEKESNHAYSDEEYFALIKHELSHAFTNAVAGGFCPNWLNEGLAIYLSEQLKHRKNKPTKYETFLQFHNSGNETIYNESGYAVEFLLQQYGRDKMLLLLGGSKHAKDEKIFKEFFHQTYGFALEYANFKIL